MGHDSVATETDLSAARVSPHLWNNISFNSKRRLFGHAAEGCRVFSRGKMAVASRIFRQIVPRSAAFVCETSRGPLLSEPLTIQLPGHQCAAGHTPFTLSVYRLYEW
ncbi:hypothetical protein V8C35DRAFT_280689 [Trichoderma chlorosporum]